MEPLYCTICRGRFEHFNHRDSPLHRFHFKLWAFKHYKKAIDQKGIEMKFKLEPNQEGLKFSFNKRCDKFTINAQMNQLILNNNTVRLKCIITNNSQLAYCLKERDFLYNPSSFSLHGDSYFFSPPNNFMPELHPGDDYDFTIQYKLDQPIPGSNKVYIACNFQNDDISDSFSIIKSIIVNVSGLTDEDATEEQSPYISEKWEDVHTTHKPTQQFRYPDRYPIPEEYLILLKNEQNFNAKKVEEHVFHKIQQILGSYQRVQLINYQEYWHILLWLEELSLMVMLEKYNMSGVTVEMKNFESIIIEVPGLEEKRPSIVAGDFIKLRLKGDHTAYEGIVKFIREKSIEVFYVEDELFAILDLDPNTIFDINFVLNRLSFIRMHEGVDKLAAHRQIPLLFDPINPVQYQQIYNLTDRDFYNKQIIHNPEQKKAVIKILNSKQKQPYIVYGPPGTGKTITIVEAILQILKRTNRKILVCAPSNSACDNITEKLIPYCQKSQLIRVHSETRERSTLSPELLNYSNIEGDIVMKKIDIKKYRIVVTTLTLIGRYRDYKPNCVFIDEAAQAAEPEAAIAIGLLEVGKLIVLAGDPQQLGPMCVSDTAKKYGFNISLLERLMTISRYRTFDDNFVIMLRSNYRSHRDILQLPNELFYSSRLIPKSEMNDPISGIAIYPRTNRRNGVIRQLRGVAIEFCGLMSKEKKEGASPSFFNPHEVEMVIKYVQAILSNDFPTKVQESDIGVLTPYKRQVYKIKNRFVRLNWKNIEVGTTESFQGREKRIIIISTVRAQHCYLKHDRKYNLGFVRNEKRFNVALTRAKSKLILIGCPQVLGYDEKWLKFMELCKQQKSHFGIEYKPRTDEVMDDISERMEDFHI